MLDKHVALFTVHLLAKLIKCARISEEVSDNTARNYRNPKDTNPIGLDCTCHRLQRDPIVQNLDGISARDQKTRRKRQKHERGYKPQYSGHRHKERGHEMGSSGNNDQWGERKRKPYASENQEERVCQGNLDLVATALRCFSVRKTSHCAPLTAVCRPSPECCEPGAR
jgi:hypothetical protein